MEFAGSRLMEIICNACNAPLVTSTCAGVHSMPVAHMCAAIASRNAGSPSGGG